MYRVKLRKIRDSFWFCQYKHTRLSLKPKNLRFFLSFFANFLYKKRRYTFLSLSWPHLKSIIMYKASVFRGFRGVFSENFSPFSDTFFQFLVYNHDICYISAIKCWYFQNESLFKMSLLYSCLTQSKIQNYLNYSSFKSFRAFLTPFLNNFLSCLRFWPG